jgi:hypothetical protein
MEKFNSQPPSYLVPKETTPEVPSCFSAPLELPLTSERLFTLICCSFSAWL